jgi:hypothetical protein
VMATDITPPARWIPRCLECRHPAIRHAADCTVGKAFAEQLERLAKEERDREEEERNRRLQIWAAVRWRRVVIAAAAKRTERGIAFAWVVFVGGER